MYHLLQSLQYPHFSQKIQACTYPSYLQPTATTLLKGINRLVFVTESECVYCEVGIEMP